MMQSSIDVWKIQNIMQMLNITMDPEVESDLQIVLLKVLLLALLKVFLPKKSAQKSTI